MSTEKYGETKNFRFFLSAEKDWDEDTVRKRALGPGNFCLSWHGNLDFHD